MLPNGTGRRHGRELLNDASSVNEMKNSVYTIKYQLVTRDLNIIYKYTRTNTHTHEKMCSVYMNVLLDIRPSANRQPTVSQPSANRQPTVSQPSANRQPTLTTKVDAITKKCITIVDILVTIALPAITGNYR